MNVQQHFVIVTTHDFDRLLQFVHTAWIVSILLVVVVVGGYGIGLCERYVCGIFLFYSILYSYMDNFTPILFKYLCNNNNKNVFTVLSNT